MRTVVLAWEIHGWQGASAKQALARRVQLNIGHHRSIDECEFPGHMIVGKVSCPATLALFQVDLGVRAGGVEIKSSTSIRAAARELLVTGDPASVTVTVEPG